MPKVEPWRLNEMAMILDDLVLTLQAGKNPEWAAVFGHFVHELNLIRSAGELKADELRRFIRSLKLCFTGSSTFSDLIIKAEEPGEQADLNLRFARLRAQVMKALGDIEERLVEFVN